MLVLTRRVGEEIVIGGDIRIMVIAVKGNSVRLGVKAPPAIAVDRQEVHERRLLATEEFADPSRTFLDLQTNLPTESRR